MHGHVLRNRGQSAFAMVGASPQADPSLLVRDDQGRRNRRALVDFPEVADMAFAGKGPAMPLPRIARPDPEP